MKTIKFIVGLVSIIGLTFGISCSKSSEPKEAEVPPEKEVTVKVMTYNIYGARSGGIPDLQPLADVIKRADPDLVALQEVDKNTSRNAKHGDIAKKLGELTGMDYFFAKADNFYGGEYGDAVLSKLPVKEKKGFNLEVDPTLGGERRSVARIKVEKEGKAFYFLSTHFDHLGDERNRIKQSTDFVTMVKEFDLPVIGGGDLNARPDSETMRIVRTYFTMGCLNGNCSQPTFPSSGGDRTIDYLFYAPLDAFTPKQYGVYTWANKESDHFPVLAVFKIN
ncbi:MAG TPA: endonuclease [Porphyromonadaceae bacterium]|jgi:endonuclease/exonuclease/phosphatase family metal-dependent hydrolase|uniref:endonuclease/exonuclease/phosphatase family protein n=1 Tax=Limibacterium fermenti TaxID=3229863 RepID=UPI000E93CD55|nr:endonuclease [Porphyromonadaceae bacterium]HBK32710.1 endonuclease [Porphyromonadaceae bacterium]HBL33810.1 endonuclease [Porphyromonadaceae bacterium]HBX20031.1 endonuclease [Porphyromonadaceae bacterium]HBX44868.1 endonuclease [Porphyromonadaceae bacterium]